MGTPIRAAVMCGGLGLPGGLLVEAFLSRWAPRDLTWFVRLHNTFALMLMIHFCGLPLVQCLR